MESAAPKLKALRQRTTPKISIRDLATALGMPSSSYAAYEDEKKFKKPILPLDLAKRIAVIFAGLGIPESETLELAGLTGELSSSVFNLPSDDEWVEVKASVAAGVWREHNEWPAAQRYEVKFGKSRFPDARRFGLRMDGLSMNRTIPPGTDLECIAVAYSTFDPKPGDLVIVERTAHDLTEMTCKRLDVEGDEWVLRCESTEAEFQSPIRIGKPDEAYFADHEIRVVGIVVSGKMDLASPNLSERRYRHQ